MTNSVKKSNSNSYRTKKVLLIGGGVIILLILLALLAGPIKYVAAVIGCGHTPYAVEFTTSFGSAGYQYYTNPTDKVAKSIRNKYYCSKQEVIAAGYKHDPLAIPLSK